MSQEKEILNHLLSGKSITPLEALQSYGVFRLGAIIFKLRKRYNIETDFAKGKHYAIYKLVREEKQMEFI